MGQFWELQVLLCSDSPVQSDGIIGPLQLLVRVWTPPPQATGQSVYGDQLVPETNFESMNLKKIKL